MRKIRVIIIIILLLLAGASVWYFFYKKEEQQISLITESPGYGYISKSVTATGTIQPVDTVSVGAQVSGTISAIYTDFNAKVRKGQLLAELDKALFQAQVNQFKANLAVANSSLAYNKSNFDRQTLLYNAGAISKADFENAQNLYQSAKANVASVQAQLDASLKNLSYTSIYSPVDGVVMTRNISVGQTVASSFSTPTLFIIAKDISRMQVQAAVSEADIGDVRVGLRSTFTVDAYPDITFTGNVSQIRLEPVVTSNVVTYTTIITAPNEDLKLRPGMTANIFVYTREVDSALLISAKALKYKPSDALAKQFIIQADSHRIASAARKSAGQGSSGPGSTRQGYSGQGSSGQGSAAQGSSQQSSPASVHNIHDINARKIDSSGQKATYGYVWVRQGDSITERRIRTGLNNDTQVQVLAGLSVGDEIVTGEEIPVKGSSAKSGAVKSPFMPARRSSGSGNKPAAGGK
jgi:HlyD family secretion protein